MQTLTSNPPNEQSVITPEENIKQEESLLGPSWENWRNEQIQTISMILVQVFKIEDEARQSQSTSRLLRHPAIKSGGNPEKIREKLGMLRQQISEYEKMLQLG